MGWAGREGAGGRMVAVLYTMKIHRRVLMMMPHFRMVVALYTMMIRRVLT